VSLLPRRLRHGEEATLVEHLGELRARIVVSLVALFTGFGVAYAVHGHILEWLNRPLPNDIGKPITLGPAEPFLTSIKISLLAGFLLALPIILWQVWAFLAPAVAEHSQRVISAFVSLATLLLVGGIAFGYYVALPAAIHFLTNFDNTHYQIELRAKDYYSFTTLVLFAMAVVFVLPVFVLGLVRLRVLTAAQLRRNWRVGIVSVVALSVALPGVDPVTTTIETVPLLFLYFLAVGLASFLEPRWRGTRAPEAATDV
jgi:sec-independent protein translocase protein TatC